MDEMVKYIRDWFPVGDPHYQENLEDLDKDLKTYKKELERFFENHETPEKGGGGRPIKRKKEHWLPEELEEYMGEYFKEG